MFTGTALSDWRKAHAIKQAALAEYVGVTQAAVSRWERGIDAPNLGARARLRDLMARMLNGDADIKRHRIFVQNQCDNRALFDYDGIQFLACSEAFCQMWPEFTACQGMMLRDYMVGDTLKLVEDVELRHAILAGDMLYVAGVSDRHTAGAEADAGCDEGLAERHCWSARFQHVGRRVLVEMSYSPCRSDRPVGLDKVVRLSAC